MLLGENSFLSPPSGGKMAKVEPVPCNACWRAGSVGLTAALHMAGGVWRVPKAALGSVEEKAMLNPEGLVGEVLDGKYRLAEFMGEGSFGYVYSADLIVGGQARSQCTIKIMQPWSTELREAIWSEQWAAAQLLHPGLVQLRAAFDVSDGPLEGALCLVMEFCEGTLARRLSAGRRLAAEEVVAVARDLAEVLAWLSAQGAVYRDVEPANVFRVGDRWKLGHLVITRALRVMRAMREWDLPTGALPSASELIHLAPEVLDDRVEPACDVWSLGALLQEALAGVLAYNATSQLALVKAMMTQEPTIAPDLPSPFDAVVRGCLVKDPRSRWTAEQVLQALSGSDAPARPSVGGPRSEVVASAPRGLVALGRNAQGRERFQVEWGGPVLVSLPAGRFVMGSPAGEGRFGWEAQHEVVLSRGFLLGEAPVTEAEYEAVVVANPYLFKFTGPQRLQFVCRGRRMVVASPCQFRFTERDRPVGWGSWFDAVSFCNALSRRAGLEEAYVVDGEEVTWKGLSCPGFRLPTEAEWEYACRAGTAEARYGDLNAVAWYSNSSRSHTYPVRQNQPNAWGLYDTLGNEWEWCWDWYGYYPEGVVTDPVGPGSGSDRVARGGSWGYGADYARAACRNSRNPAHINDELGFRLARSLP
jgi:formylglycine-generating enzyme required for sulfatase activity